MQIKVASACIFFYITGICLNCLEKYKHVCEIEEESEQLNESVSFENNGICKYVCERDSVCMSVCVCVCVCVIWSFLNACDKKSANVCMYMHVIDKFYI